MSNHLKNETSPYLLQHAENPVDWYPWGDEAFARAKTENKPVFLSIGYSTCHWCHVMAHESFENADIAKILNDRYIAVKVDREERPDIDSVYMSVCQALTGSGGWPMSIFMSWDKKPFFAGTYFPPRDSFGRIGFARLLTEIADLWEQDQGRLLGAADYIIDKIKETERAKSQNGTDADAATGKADRASADARSRETNPAATDTQSGETGQELVGTQSGETDQEFVGTQGGGTGQEFVGTRSGGTAQEFTDTLIGDAVQIFADSFDHEYGGFGRAPKFPAPHNLLFLMLYSTQNQDMGMLSMVEQTLLQMRKGGIFDQIGFGFSRYSTDPYFLAPHFEKMLYDNALLIIAYAAAYSMTEDDRYLDTARKTAEYILREMTSEEGGFYSAQDADSDGVEGKYYTFTLDEIIQVLGAEKGRRFAAVFDITDEGNFEGVNIPNLLKSNDLETDFTEERKLLYEYRRKRTRLHLDDKILLSWNAMMIAAFSVLFRVSRDETYLRAAQRAQSLIEERLCSGKQLYTSMRGDKRADKAFLDDYAYYVAALIELYNSTLDRQYLKRAEELCQEAVTHFADKENGGFFLCATDTELFINPKETYDGAVPSGNSVMAYNLVRLYQLTEQESYRKLAEQQLRFLAQRAGEYPAGHSMFLFAKLIYENPPRHVTIVVKDISELPTKDIHLPLLANVCVARESAAYPLLNDSTTYYVCKDHMCLPASNVLNI